MHRYLPLLLIIALLIAFRFVGSISGNAFPNFQPLAAVFFCGAMLAPGWRGLAIPLGIWLVTYPLDMGPVIDFTTFITTLLAFVGVYFFGKNFAQQRPIFLIGGSLVAAILFHLITNGVLWIAEPIYAKSPEGLWQSLWTGPPNAVLPSWVFLRNFAAANVLFTTIFAIAQLRLPKTVTLTSAPVLAK